jgi:hypothetical protein
LEVYNQLDRNLEGVADSQVGVVENLVVLVVDSPEGLVDNPEEAADGPEEAADSPEEAVVDNPGVVAAQVEKLVSDPLQVLNHYHSFHKIWKHHHSGYHSLHSVTFGIHQSNNY